MKYIIASKKKIENIKTLKISEYLYLIAIFYYSLCALNSSVFNYNNGVVPTFLTEFFPFLAHLMKPKNSDYNASNKSIIIYFIVIDLIRRPIIPFSRIVKFNIVLTYLIEFSFLILAQIWEIFVTREIIVPGDQFREKRGVYDIFYSIIWLIYASIYIYCAILAFQNKYPKFSRPFEKIVPSIHMYLNKKQHIQASKN